MTDLFKKAQQLTFGDDLTIEGEPYRFAGMLHERSSSLIIYEYIPLEQAGGKRKEGVPSILAVEDKKMSLCLYTCTSCGWCGNSAQIMCWMTTPNPYCPECGKQTLSDRYM